MTLSTPSPPPSYILCKSPDHAAPSQTLPLPPFPPTYFVSPPSHGWVEEGGRDLDLQLGRLSKSEREEGWENRGSTLSSSSCEWTIHYYLHYCSEATGARLIDCDTHREPVLVDEEVVLPARSSDDDPVKVPRGLGAVRASERKEVRS